MKSTKYQVFLSSTYSDLADERESIIKAILEMYHIPIGMEMFSAEDEDQWEIIRRTIEVSDYYVLVLGLRYGSKTSEGISFTQKEYEYALEKNIPILAFVMKDTVSLSKGKRDDDLSEINAFRELVLTNSKMAQFWESKDQLIKSVSISLMKQIMQKPGIGWIRGDNARTEEALSKELTALSKENRELRERVTELESKISLKIPAIGVDIAPPVVDEHFNSYIKTEMPESLRFEDIEEHLLEFISKQDIEKYNSSIPSQKDLDDYNKECETFYKIKNYSSALVIEVSNSGSAKANNIYVDIEFPEGVLIYEIGEKHSEPKNPIPFNPIERAQYKYEEKLKEKAAALSGLHSRLGLRNEFMGFSSIVRPEFDLPNIRPINQRWWTRLEGRKMTIKIDDLLHTRRMTFDDEYMVVPLIAGKIAIEVRVICEEYDDTINTVVELNI
ncbi:DUF4062 domain-containing protein [Cellvibrio sp. UBA7661]|uniref:DUF4062 domain-containing protein n=1 Tax=Cellvibrio sp. UBA7661 TaxID=1946311 RepID=UPI002F356401